MINQYKSTADAAALLAISELYRGMATLELVDMTKVAASGAGLTVADEDRPKISEAGTHFRAAAEALSRAAEVCSKFRAKLGKNERSAFLDCDTESFKHLSDTLSRMEVTKGAAFPAFEDVAAAVRAINEATASWGKSAEALRGLPGHYPATPAPRP